MWDHQHQGKQCKSFPPKIFLGICNAGTVPRDKSLLRESFQIPDEVSVTATKAANSPLQWEASACSGLGPRKSRPRALGGKGKQQGLHEGNSTHQGSPAELHVNNSQKRECSLSVIQGIPRSCRVPPATPVPL